MNKVNKNLILKFEIEKAPDFKNPFLYYYPGCYKNLIKKNNYICPICYKNLKDNFVVPDSRTHYFFFSYLTKWNKFSSICSMCRKLFNSFK